MSVLTRVTAAHLHALPRWLAATLRGVYPGRSRLLPMAAAALYIVSPVDLVPEVLLGPLGLVDDAAVLAWLASAALTETEAFMRFEGSGVSVRRTGRY